MFHVMLRASALRFGLRSREMTGYLIWRRPLPSCARRAFVHLRRKWSKGTAFFVSQTTWAQRLERHLLNHKMLSDSALRQDVICGTSRRASIRRRKEMPSVDARIGYGRESRIDRPQKKPRCLGSFGSEFRASASKL